MPTVQPFSFTYTRSNAGLSLAQPLELKPKQMIWLVGNSGSGKSTFLHLLKGFYPEFLTGQLSGQSPDALKNAAYIAQNPLSQIVHERVGEEFFFSMENALWSFDAMEAKRDWLHRFDLSKREFEPTQQLSHGFAQRLLIASMLAFEPEWIVFDEPSAFLNPAVRDDFYAILQSLKGQIGMLLIDHHPHAAQIADVCWHVADNGVIAQISVADWLALQNKILENTSPQNFAEIFNINSTLELNLKNLTVGYRNKPLFTANAQLQSGECAVLIGENGSGKSTFFNTLAGVQKPLAGSIELMLNQKNANISAHMAYVFQHPDSHFLCDTIGEELRQLGVIDVEHALLQIGLEGRSESSPHQLSEGQKRRLTLLYPCLQKRPLILLDEPTFGQDAVNTQRIIGLIQQLKQAGYALIVVTHDEEVQQQIATHIWRIEHGVLHHD